jgi:stage II sporulation protein D
LGEALAERRFLLMGRGLMLSLSRGRMLGHRLVLGRFALPVPVIVAMAVAALSFGLGAEASAKTPTEVRVLLYDSAEPVLIGRLGSSGQVRLADARELIVPGQGRLRKWSPSGKGPFRVGDRIVRGRVDVRADQGRIQVLNRVGLEEYVASTVGGEMMASWPREALRAQAVAARTYVLHEAAKRQHEQWDVLATTQSQVYLGVSSETAETRAAARATEGQVLTYRGEPILAVFHSTAGGRTEAAGDVWGEDRPYLRVVDVDDEDDAPNTYWRRMVPRPALADTFDTIGLGVGRLKSLEVVERTRGGRVKRLLIRGANRTVVADRERLARLASELELPSRLFEIRSIDQGYAFVGSGHGHGVGMSQWGARAMAQRGNSYKRILETFYPGARLETWSPKKGALARATGALVLSSHARQTIDPDTGAIAGGLR